MSDFEKIDSMRQLLKKTNHTCGSCDFETRDRLLVKNRNFNKNL